MVLGVLAILVLGMGGSPKVTKAEPGGYITFYPDPNLNYNKEYDEAPNPSPTINSINPNSSNKGTGTKSVVITGSGFVPSSVAKMNGADRPTTFIDSSHLLIKLADGDLNRNDPFFITVYNKAPGGGYSNAASFKIKNPGATAVVSGTQNNNNTNGIDNNNTSSSDTFTETPTQGQNTQNGQNNSNLASNAIFGTNGFMPSGLVQWVFFAIIVLVIIILVRKIMGGSEAYHATPLKHD